MKAITLSALTLMCSATLVGELPQQTAETKTIVSSTPTPTNFCGQPEMLRWFFNSEIGRQLQRRQQAAIAQAIADHETAAPQK